MMLILIQQRQFDFLLAQNIKVDVNTKCQGFISCFYHVRLMLVAWSSHVCLMLEKQTKLIM